jgi:uncharacterized protein (TIGR02996 family)
MPDSPDPDLLDAILADPDDESPWLNLARWLWDNGRGDEAAAVRVFWPTLADSVAVGRTPDSALDVVRRNAARLGRRAREFEEGAVTEPESRG